MSYKYRKPKNVNEAIELCKLAGVQPSWPFTNQSAVIDNQKYFNIYEPILFIYKNQKLMAASHNKLGRPQIIDLNNKDITSTFKKETLSEIDVNIKQIELF